jgi:hypothetical protein
MVLVHLNDTIMKLLLIFRRGGASLAARSGVAPHLIQLLADWESEAYKQYVVHSLTEKYKVAR